MILHVAPLLVFMALAVFMVRETYSAHYRCLRCGASRPDMHSSWCEERDSE